MRNPSILVLVAASVLTAHGAPAAGAADTASQPTQAPEAAVTVYKAGDLPLVVPGYRLEELDVKKSCIVRVGGKVFELRIPVLVYFPTEAGTRTSAVKDLHDVYDALVDLAAKPSAAPSDFQAVLQKLDSALTKLESVPAPTPSQSATASSPVEPGAAKMPPPSEAVPAGRNS